MKKQKNISPQNKTPDPSGSWLDRFSRRDTYIVCAVIIVLLLLIFYRGYVFQGLEPVGGDIISAMGQRHQIQEFEARTGEQPLWNPHVFCGIPTYHLHGGRAFHIDRLIIWLDSFLDWRFCWLLFGAIGIFLLFRELKFQWYYALIAALAFLFLPHFQALFTVGHNAKIRAIFSMPWVIFGFLRLTRKSDLFSTLLFILAFSLQLRSKHYQIIFYTLLYIAAIGIWKIVVWLRQKETQLLLRTVGLFIVGLVISVAMCAKPLFISGEYTPYSTRGGDAIQLQKEEGQPKSSGVSPEYATQWSLHPAEMMNLIIPRFFGGTSQEVYSGKIYQKLQGQKLPTYWGAMPFTQSSEYIGIICVVMAFIGFWIYRRNGFVISVSILLVFSLLLAFGRHFPPVYQTLFRYLPYFSKFRVPSMILNLVSLLVITLAVFGIKGLVENLSAERLKITGIIIGIFAGLGLLFLLIPGLLSYTSFRDSAYANKPQIIEMLQTVRREFLKMDTLRMLAFLVALFTLIQLVYRKIINRDLMVIGILLLVAIDMIGVSSRFSDPTQLVNLDQYEKQYFRQTAFDRIIQQESEPSRVLALGSLFQSNDLAYRHSIFGGYSAIKPQLIQDIIDNNLYRRDDPNDFLNWNVINMCNVRFLITPGRLDHENLTALDTDTRRQTVLYRNNSALPRAYFVSRLKILNDEEAVVRYLNRRDFQPSELALLSGDLDLPATYGTGGQITFREYNPNSVMLEVDAAETAFMVLADAYYPKGWTAEIDGHETPIYQVNHLLRGIEVPAGEHTIIFRFQPQTYRSASLISAIFTYAVWLALIAICIWHFRSQSGIRNTAQKTAPKPKTENPSVDHEN